MINNKIRNQYSNNSERQWMASIRDMEEHPSPMTDAFLRPAYDRTVACAIPERRPKQTLAIKDVYKRQEGGGRGVGFKKEVAGYREKIGTH